MDLSTADHSANATSSSDASNASSGGNASTPSVGHPSTSSLRFKINAIFCAVSVLVLVVLAIVQMIAARSSIREEVTASNRVATQLLRRITVLYAAKGLDSLADFLGDTGRVRANELRLLDNAGQVKYVSPPASYKFGRNAPSWYATLVTPEITPQIIQMTDGSLSITPNPSRSVLDAWEDLQFIFLIEALLLLAANLLMLLIVGRWLAPLDKIHSALLDIENGRHTIRLPALPGKEAGEMARAFNRMAQAVEDNIAVRQFSAETTSRLAAQREFTALLHQRIEEERAALARELHDEFGQSLTAIRSIAKSMMHQLEGQHSPLEQSVRMLFDTAGSTADALQRMIPRLRPIQLEGMGLIDALRDLIADRQMTDPQLKIDARFDLALVELPDEVDRSIYRIVQEGLTNVLRHANASQVIISLQEEQAVAPADTALRLVISDDGIGGCANLKRPGHYGIRGMQERVESLGGTIDFRNGSLGGLEVDVSIPFSIDSNQSGSSSKASSATFLGTSMPLLISQKASA